MLIFKILTSAEWQTLTADGQSAGAPVDLADGFIHFSTADQVHATAAKHFADQDDLWLLAFDADTLGPALKWEPSRGGALFPHLYAALRHGDVVWAKPLTLRDGVHDFPDLGA